MSENYTIFQSTFLFSSTGIAVLGRSGKIRLSNLAMQDLLGCEEDQLLGSYFHQYLHPEDREEFMAGMKSVLAGRLTTF